MLARPSKLASRTWITTGAGLLGVLALVLSAGCNSGSREDAATAAALTSGTATPVASQIVVLRIQVTGPGSVRVDPPSPANGYPPGTTVTLEARPTPGSVFQGWGGSLGADDRYRLSFQIAADTDLAPTFDAATAGTPIADFAVAGETTWAAPLTVQFTNSSQGPPARSAWEFGDGGTADTADASHTYTTPGVYTVVLKVYDAAGAAGQPKVEERLITVVDPAQGSRFWYANDQYGNPAKENSLAERALARQVFDLCNQERAKVGAPPLTYGIPAERAAKAHSSDMVNRAYFDHVTPEGWQPVDRLIATGATGYLSNGENIAAGQQSPADVMASWMNSPGHRANILNPDFTHLGVGIEVYQGTTPIWTQVFLRR